MALPPRSHGARTLWLHAYQSYVFNVGVSAACAAGDLAGELPLVGASTPALDAATPAGAAMRAVLAEDGIDRAAFASAKLRGAARPVAIRARGFEGCVDAAAQRVEAAFELPAGAYATTLLRELFVDVETERGVVGSAPD